MRRYIWRIEALERIVQLEAEVAELKAIIAGLRAQIADLMKGKGSDTQCRPAVNVKSNSHKQKRGR